MIAAELGHRCVAMSQSQRTVASLGLPQALQDQLSAANYVYVDDLKGVRPIELARDLKVPNEEALRVLKAANAPATKLLAGASTVVHSIWATSAGLSPRGAQVRRRPDSRAPRTLAVWLTRPNAHPLSSAALCCPTFSLAARRRSAA